MVSVTTEPARYRVDPRLVDVVLAVAMALAVALVIAADPASVDPNPWAYLFAVLFGALLLVRRVVPRTMLAVTVLAVFVYYALDLAPIGITLPAVAALYACAEAARTWFAVGAGTVLVGVAAFFLIREGQPTTYLLSYELLTNLALFAAAVSLGVAVRRTRETRAHAEQIRILTATEQAEAARRTLQDERVRIARELHDTVGHDLSVVSVHASVAAEAIGRDDPAAVAALDRVRETTSRSLRELRATVKLLRSEDEAPPMGNGLASLDTLVGGAVETGLEVRLDIDVPVGSIDAAIDAAAYRIVQESLTNVIRHANARHVEIVARLEEGTICLSIIDDGDGSAGHAPLTEGSGLSGMRERASLLGGSLTTRDGSGGGFRVEARLPAILGA